MALVPEIKLIRTDTTLDLSQKAEKVWFYTKTQLYLWTKKKIWNTVRKKNQKLLLKIYTNFLWCEVQFRLTTKLVQVSLQNGIFF